MPSTYSNLKIQLMATGENNTTWGDITNLNLGTAIDEAIGGSAVVTFADADVTLPWTDSNASQTARNLRLSLSGSATAGYDLIVPSIEKSYIINNGTDGDITVKNATGVGVVVPTGKTMWVYNNSTNIVNVVSHLTSLTLGTALPVTSGGTGGNSGSTARASLNVPGLASNNTFTGSQTINQSSTSAALYVTQGGAGSALEVDNGNVLFGGATTYTMGLTPKLQISSITGGGSTVNTITWSAATPSTCPQYAFGRSRGATAGAYTAVASGDDLGIISFYGTNGTSFDRAAYISGVTDGTPGVTNVPGRLAFFTGSTSSDPLERMRIDSSGNVIVTGSGGLGYGTGSGGAVTQATSRTTGVTLNKTNGAITLVSAAGTAAWQSFTVTNSTVAATDTVIVSQKSGTDLYQIFVTAVGAGSFRISFATTGGTTTEQPVFNFAVIKAVTA